MGDSLKHARKLAGRITLPDPWRVEDLCASLAAKRSRPIRLIVREPAGDSITATVIATAAADYIFCRSDLAGLHRDHAICHELGHLVAGHVDQPDPGIGLSPDAAQAMVCFRDCDYGSDREGVAETIADVIMERVSQRVGRHDHGSLRIVDGFRTALR